MRGPSDVPFPALSPDFAAVLSLLDSTAGLRYATESVRRQLGADLAAGARHVGDDIIEIRAVVGARTEQLNGLTVRPMEGLGGQAVVLRRTVAVDDYCASQSITHDFDEQVRAEGLHAVMAAPIVRAHRLYGVLYAARRSAEPWTDRDRVDLLIFARQTAVAMEVADAAQEMAEVAVYAERNRLAIGLHDTVGATLFSLRATLTSIEPDLPVGLPRDRLIHAVSLAERAATEMRRQTRSLHDTPSDKELAVAIRGDCRELADRADIAAELVVLGKLPRLDPASTDALRRATREALLNVEKHANGHSVLVSLYPADDGLGLSVADDGTVGEVGPAGERGLGLRAIAERLERVGGWLSFDVTDEGGGAVRAWVPAAKARPPVVP